MAAVLRLVLVTTPVTGLALGGEPRRVDQRDRKVLEVALRDFLNPKNPSYANAERDIRPPPRVPTIVLHRLVGGDEDADIFIDEKMVPAEVLTSWRRRNAGRPIPLKDIGLQSKEFIAIDLDRLDEEAQKAHKSFWELFWERYPESIGCAQVSLPGYSRGGVAALVEFSVGRGPYHPTIHLVLLAKVEGRWNVKWRHRETW
jgi:hypothetical protein